MSLLEDWDLDYLRAVLGERARALRIDPRVQVRFNESDLVQETFLRAADPGRGRCEGETDGERLAWLFAIQERVLLDKYDEQFAQRRDPRREVGVAALLRAFVDSTAEFIPTPREPGPGPAEQAGRREEMEILDELLGQMPGELGEVLTARREGLTLAEIATRLGVSPGVAAGRLVKATKLLLALSRKHREG